MEHLHMALEAPRSSVGRTLFKMAIVAAVFVGGYKLMYYLDSDWDDDGVPNKVEQKCHMDPRKTDSDDDGLKDGSDSYPLFPESAGFSPDSNTVICLTSPKGRKTVCFHPSDILLFEKGPGGYEVFDWQGEVEYVQENLTAIEGMMLNVGYSHFYRINPQDLANMLLAECLDKDMTKLRLSREENIWCHVPQGKRRDVLKRINKFCEEE